MDAEGGAKRVDALRTTKGEWNERRGARRDVASVRGRTRRRVAREDMLVVRRRVWGGTCEDLGTCR